MTHPIHAPRLIHQCRSVVLLTGILILLFTTPWASADGVAGHILRVFYILIFCIGGYLLNPTKAWLKRYLSFGIPLTAIVMMQRLQFIPLQMELVINFFVLALQLHVFQAVFTHILFSRSTPAGSKVLGGICGYLLLGIIFANIYTIVLIFNPGAIQLTLHSAAQQSELTYYSLVTLTTLGYGDIVSISDTARTISALEAIAGNLYLAILISTLASQLFANFKLGDRNT